MSKIARFAASGMQQQFVFASLDGRSMNNLVIALRFEGPFAERALERALRQLVARHETLRTTLHPGDPPEQRVAAEQPLELERIVLSDTGDARAAALDLMAERVAQRLPLRGPLVRMTLARLGPRDHVVSLAIHHALVDGWSLRLLTRDLTALYRAAVEGGDAALPPIELGVPDYATWEQEARHEHADWWRRLLGDRDLHGSIGPPQPLAPIRPTEEVVRERMLAAAATVERLRAFVARAGLTMSSTLMAALSTTMTTWDVHDVVMGVLSANREHPGLRSTAGCFADFVPVRVDASGDPTFAELAERVHAAAREAYAHRIPFAALHRALGNDGPWHAARVMDLSLNYLPMRARRADGHEPGDSSPTAIHELTLPLPRYRFKMDRDLAQPARFGMMAVPDGEALRGSLGAEPLWLPEARQVALEETQIAVFERAAARPGARISELVAGT